MDSEFKFFLCFFLFIGMLCIGVGGCYLTEQSMINNHETEMIDEGYEQRVISLETTKTKQVTRWIKPEIDTP